VKTDKEILDWLGSRLTVSINQHHDPYEGKDGRSGMTANSEGRVDLFTLESQHTVRNAPSLRAAVTQAMEMKPIVVWEDQPCSPPS
jgi:hypothetical protein